MFRKQFRNLTFFQLHDILKEKRALNYFLMLSLLEEGIDNEF